MSSRSTRVEPNAGRFAVIDFHVCAEVLGDEEVRLVVVGAVAVEARRSSGPRAVAARLDGRDPARAGQPGRLQLVE